MKHFCILLLVFVLAPWAFAERIVVASELYPGYVNDDKTGMYLDILSEVYPTAEIELIVTTYERAIRLVENKKADLWLGAYYRERNNALYPNYYFDHDKVAAVYLADNFSFEEIDSLFEKKAAWVSGYNYDRYFSFKQEAYLVIDLETGFRMLEAGRIDLLIDDLNVIKKSPAFNQLMKVQILKRIAIYPAFTKTDRGFDLMNKWDKNMKNIIDNGTLKAIFDLDPASEYPYKEINSNHEAPDK